MKLPRSSSRSRDRRTDASLVWFEQNSKFPTNGRTMMIGEWRRTEFYTRSVCIVLSLRRNWLKIIFYRYIFNVSIFPCEFEPAPARHSTCGLTDFGARFVHLCLWTSPDFVVLDNYYYIVNHLHHRDQTIDLVSPTTFPSDLTLDNLFKQIWHKLFSHQVSALADEQEIALR